MRMKKGITEKRSLLDINPTSATKPTAIPISNIRVCDSIRYRFPCLSVLKYFFQQFDMASFSGHHEGCVSRNHVVRARIYEAIAFFNSSDNGRAGTFANFQVA